MGSCSSVGSSVPTVNRKVAGSNPVGTALKLFGFKLFSRGIQKMGLSNLNGAEIIEIIILVVLLIIFGMSWISFTKLSSKDEGVSDTDFKNTCGIGKSTIKTNLWMTGLGALFSLLALVISFTQVKRKY